MKIRASVARKVETDRTPCEVIRVEMIRVKPIDPNKVYGMQKWEWLKELVAATAVSSLNAFEYRVWSLPGCVEKINKALAGMVRDSGGNFEAKARVIGGDSQAEILRISVKWANEEAQKVWLKNVKSMRQANVRFRKRRPDLVDHATARNKVRQRILGGDYGHHQENER